MSFGIYIHWPYCLSKCPYCDFYKEVKKNIPQDEIIGGYLKELDFYREMTSERTITSVFFGGGTPSLIKPKNISRILNHVSKGWKTDSNIEISLEANPNSQYPQMFYDLRAAGINRLSLGVQALNEPDLRFLGRTHNLKEARKAIDEVLHHFENHSIDLIFGRPQQKAEDWQKELEEAVGYGLKHISLYQLTIEEGTVFAKKGIEALAEDKAAEMYDFTGAFLVGRGYGQYEVSNYARPGYESRHNLLYWQGDDFIGIGNSAAGRLTYGTGENKKFYETSYCCRVTELAAEEKAEELLLMGLRLVSGLNKNKFKQVCGIDFDTFVNKSQKQTLKSEGLLEESTTNIRATRKGFLLLNKIIEKLAG